MSGLKNIVFAILMIYESYETSILGSPSPILKDFTPAARKVPYIGFQRSGAS